MSSVTVNSSGTYRGVVRVPGDKSASHRALLLSALSSGVSTIEGLSAGHDVLGTADILAKLNVHIETHESGTSVDGPSAGLRSFDGELNCGNSGTTIRLLAGVLAGTAGDHVLVGDASLSKRPMNRVANPLRLMGASIVGIGSQEFPPLQISGAKLRGISYDVPVPSAQVKSAILLAGLFADGPTHVFEPVRTRTTTEDMLAVAGIEIAVATEGTGRHIRLSPGRPAARRWAIPCDPSQAAFFCVLGAIASDADIAIVDVDTSPERIGFLHVLRRMGADIQGDPLGGAVTLRARSSSLTATEIDSDEIPSVDEAPILAIAAAAASGTSVFRNMGELRLKESDRFAGCLALARAAGAKSWSQDDDFFVEGLGSASRFEPISIDADLDHRIVMSSAIAGASGRGATIAGWETVSSSYPKFFQDLDSLR